MTQSSFEDRMNADWESIKASVKEMSEERDMTRGAIELAIADLRELHRHRYNVPPHLSVSTIADNLDQSLHPDTPAVLPATDEPGVDLTSEERDHFRAGLQWTLFALGEPDSVFSKDYIAKRVASFLFYLTSHGDSTDGDVKA